MYKNIMANEDSFIKVQAKPGGEVDRCIEEAKDLSRRTGGVVELTHNSKTFLIDKNGGVITAKGG